MLAFCFLTGQHVHASPFPPVSAAATVSLITESPASDFYTAWGHSAIRINDPVNQTDEVFNFGTFDFNDSYFYLKFIKGNLLYTESIYSYSDYMANALQDPHRIIQQDLDISPGQKQAVSDELFRLYLPQNRFYKYDWARVNCSTKLRDVLQKALGADFTYNTKLPPGATSFRAHEQPYLENDLWIRFGTNIVLGSPSDRLITPFEETFLPDGLYGLLKMMHKHDTRQLVKSEHEILKGVKGTDKLTLVSPSLFFWFLFLLTTGLSLSVKAGRTIDVLVFSLSGIIGCFMLYLWFGSDHTETRNNWNLVWAFPLHLFYPMLRGKPKYYYSLLITALTICMLSGWYFIPQTMEPAVIAILAMQNIRALFNLGVRQLIDKVMAEPA